MFSCLRCQLRGLGTRQRSELDAGFRGGLYQTANRYLACSLGSSYPTSSATREVMLVEVGPRDGLQNETTNLPTDIKVTYLHGDSTLSCLLLIVLQSEH